jgi:hypothetical protein
MPTLQHTHSYIFWKVQGTSPEPWYKCADAHCTHTAPRSLILDKASICPKCFNRELILDRDALKRKRPLCIECRNTREAQMHRKAKSLLEDLLTIPSETDIQLEEIRGKADDVKGILEDGNTNDFESFFSEETEETK